MALRPRGEGAAADVYDAVYLAASTVLRRTLMVSSRGGPVGKIPTYRVAPLLLRATDDALRDVREELLASAPSPAPVRPEPATRPARECPPLALEQRYGRR